MRQKDCGREGEQNLLFTLSYFTRYIAPLMIARSERNLLSRTLAKVWKKMSLAVFLNLFV